MIHRQNDEYNGWSGTVLETPCRPFHNVTCYEANVMAQPVSAQMRAWIEENQGKHICACGCGGAINVLPKHHQRRIGIPRLVKGHSRRRPGDERFLDMLERVANGCWLWTGCVSRDRYGIFNKGGRTAVLAHRVSYELHCAPIPKGMFVCHRCDNPPCANPMHLFLGTNADNMADMIAKGRQTRGEQKKNSKLTEQHVREILALPKLPNRHGVWRAYARLNNVSDTTVRDVAHRRTWTHIVPEARA